MKQKKKIIKELVKKLEIYNNKIEDIWMYGSFKDRISDLDLIIVYKTSPLKIKFSHTINKLLYGGNIIYIPNKKKKDIFLFEELEIFSIKQNRKLSYKISSNFEKYRVITSFVERYYERRMLFNKIKNKISDENLRDIKSILFSYKAFQDISKFYNFRFKKENFFIKYKKIRKLFIKKNNNPKVKDYVNTLKIYDQAFHIKSIKIIDNIFKIETKKNFNYRFTNNINFSYTNNKKNDVPFFLGQLFNYYANQNKSLSKKIKSDFTPKKKIYYFSNDFKVYLNKKLSFLDNVFNDLKQNNFKTGLYRFIWYL